jgi:adenylosuccinate synthase
MKKGKFNIVIGAQAGSESKGKLAAWLTSHHEVKPDAIVMAASPNAGHTLIKNDLKFVSYHLPVSAVVADCPILLGPSSIINIETLIQEVKALGIARSRLHINPRAAVITQKMVEEESSNKLSNIGSTLQGVGVTRKRKMMRGFDGIVELVEDRTNYLHSLGIKVVDTVQELLEMRKTSQTVLCEMTQGFDLDLEHGIHPKYSTSKMINPAMAMAEAGVPPSWVGDVYGVFRPYPIRVSNRTGSSGPYFGATELSWKTVAENCGYPGKVEDLAEITTTTKLPRRVFSWSDLRFSRFVAVCQPTVLCLQFANYVNWKDFQKTKWSEVSHKTRNFVKEIETTYGVRVRYVGTGPDDKHMIDRGGK